MVKKGSSFLIGLLGFLGCLQAQEMDTLFIKGSQILILENTIIAPNSDTTYVLPSKEKYKIRRNPYRTSAAFYRKLSERSSSNKITKKFADLFIVRTDRKTEEAAESGLSNDIQFAEYEGLVIRGITIRHVDILEGNVFDTTQISSTRLAILANRTHIASQDRVIRSNLRIREGQRIDPILMADNERILRGVGYVEDARIYVIPNRDDYSANVIVYIKDRFSWGFEGHVDSQEKADFRLYNRNIAGFGRYGSIGTFYSSNQTPELGYDFRAGSQNSLKSINFLEFNKTNYWDRDDTGLVLQKDFLSQSIKYGGGLEVRSIRDSTLYLDGELGMGKFYHLNYQDFWFGRSFLIPSKHGQKNLIMSGRVLRNEFESRPPTTADSNSLYFNRVLFLGQMAYAKQRFIKGSYVLGFGISEDIPVGFRVSGIFGRDFNEFETRDYIGAQLFWSRYYSSIGYFYVNQEFGGYRNQGLKDGVFRSRISYFAPLQTYRRTRIRTFVNFGFENGIDQNTSQDISLLGKVRDISGFEIAGNRLFYLKSESIFYTPWYVLGFRFAPFGFVAYSHVSDRRTGTTAFSRDYLSTGIGLRLKNESLVFNTLEARFTNFWVAPQQASNPIFTISVSAPITFGNIFRYKPTLIPFE